jgi:hypothetical protein
MDQQAKSAIKSLVLDLCHTLEDEIAIQLKRCSQPGRDPQAQTFSPWVFEAERKSKPLRRLQGASDGVAIVRWG